MGERREEEHLDSVGGLDEATRLSEPAANGDVVRRWRFHDAVHAARHLSAGTG